MIGPTCCVGDCCGPGSYCCGHPDNNHEHVLSVPAPDPAPLTVQLSARKSGKTQALIESILAQAEERSLRVEVVYPKTELAAPDDREVERINSRHHFHGDACLCGFKSARSRSRTEHITSLTVEAVRRLTVTPDTIEAGAKIIWHWYVGPTLDGFDKPAYAYDRSKAMEAARAVLEAALGDTK